MYASSLRVGLPTDWYRLERLKAENARLEKEKALFLEMFTRWQHNAHKHGVTEEMLGQPLPRIDRGRSD